MHRCANINIDEDFAVYVLISCHQYFHFVTRLCTAWGHSPVTSLNKSTIQAEWLGLIDR